MATIISSQKHLDEDTVEQKREECDYTVYLTPIFHVAGQEMQAIVDGHHSLEAAKRDGFDPDFEIVSVQDDDRIALLDRSVEDYLETCYMDTDWYNIETGRPVF